MFDGQLWQSVNLRAFPKLPALFISRLTEHIGPFVKALDLLGHTGLASCTLLDVANNLRVPSAPTAGYTHTQLTTINLQGCNVITTQSLHHLLINSPFLRTLCVKGLRAVTNATLDVLALCPHLTALDMGRCSNIDGNGVRSLGAAVLARDARLALKELRLSGLQEVDDNMLATLGRAAPHLEVLDLSYCHTLHNSALEAFVCYPNLGGMDGVPTVSLTAREAGREARDPRRFIRRVTALRHLVLSYCILLTDVACSNLAHALPRLEFLELAGIGGELHDDGLVRLLRTTPYLRRLDLEDASSITDNVLSALTPPPSPSDMDADDTISSGRGRSATLSPSMQTGHALEHLIVSYTTQLTNGALTALIHGCPRLRVLEADGTHISGTVVRQFVRQIRERQTQGAELVVVDCRLIGEYVIRDLAVHTRPRRGWRAWEARKLGYLDGRDEEDLKVGQDECDEERVVLKSFYNWQTVDAVRAARERRRKATKRAQTSGRLEQASKTEVSKWTGKVKWWSPSRRSSGNNTPAMDNMDPDRDGCIVM